MNNNEPPLDDKIFIMEPITDPMSDKERIQHITNIILIINTEERAKQLAKIIMNLMNKGK